MGKVNLMRYGDDDGDTCTVELATDSFRASVIYDRTGGSGWYLVTHCMARSGRLWDWLARAITCGVPGG